MKRITLLLLLTALFIVVGCSNTQELDTEPTDNPEMDTFAQCLSDNGAIMYGAYWCGHCKYQKEGFGDSFKFVNYVECDPRGKGNNAELCIEKNINGYPTWEFSDGSFAEGVQTFPLLSEKTGCQIPPKPGEVVQEDAPAVVEEA